MRLLIHPNALTGSLKNADVPERLSEGTLALQGDLMRESDAAGFVLSSGPLRSFACVKGGFRWLGFVEIFGGS